MSIPPSFRAEKKSFIETRTAIQRMTTGYPNLHYQLCSWISPRVSSPHTIPRVPCHTHGVLS